MVQPTQDYAFYFDGKGDYVDIEDDSSLRPHAYTLEVWVKTDGVPEQEEQTLVAKGNGYGIWLNNSGGIIHRFSTIYTTNDQSKIEGGVIFPYKWHHIAVTNDGNTAKIYVDGELKKEDSVRGSLQIPTETFLRMALDPEETSPTRSTSCFKGHLTEVRLWGKALSLSDIRANMFDRLVGDEPALIGYWPLNSINNNIAIDLNLNENHGKVYGARIDGQLPPVIPVGEGIKTRQYVVRFPNETKEPSLTIHNVPPVTEGITVACWAKRTIDATSWGGGVVPLVTRSNGANSYNKYAWKLYGYSSRRIYFAVFTDNLVTANYLLPTDFDLTQWHHYAATFSGADICLYVDGKMVNSTPHVGILQDVNDAIQLGHDIWNSNSYYKFQGDMAQVQLWNLALSEEAIAKTMFNALSDQYEELVGYWPLNEGEGKRTDDNIPDNSSHYGQLSAETCWDEQLPIGINSGNWGGGTIPGGPGSGIGGTTESGKSYQIQSPSGKVLTVLGSVNYEDADVQGGVNVGTNGQKWLITEDGNLKSHLGEFTLDMVPTTDNYKQSVRIKAISPDLLTQKWELTDDGCLKNKSNGFILVMFELFGYSGLYFVDAFHPWVIPSLPNYFSSCEYTWQFQEV